MNSDRDRFLGELRLGRQLNTAAQAAALGLTVAGGLFFLLSDPVLLLVGRQGALASVLAMVVIGLTLLSAVELLAGSGERGGTHGLIRETLGGWGAFLAGWSIVAGCMALAGALAQATAQHVLILLPGIPVSSPAIAAGLVALLLLIQVFQLSPSRTWLWPTVLALLAGLAVVLLGALTAGVPAAQPGATSPGLSGLLRAVAWLATGYVALEALLISRRQIADAQQRLLPAMAAVVLVGGLGLVTITLLISWLGLPAGVTTELVMRRLREAGPLPSWLVGGLATAFLVLATSGCVMIAVRQLSGMSRGGGLPRGLRRMWRPFQVPPIPFVVVAIGSVLAAVLGQRGPLISLVAGLFLVVMILLNVAAIYSRETEPERRRSLEVPFFPLLPGLAIGVQVALLASLPSVGWLGTVVWLALGLVLYALYGRRQEAAALEGVSVFGAERTREQRRERYRILLPLAGGTERHLVLDLAMQLAGELGGELMPLQVIPVPDPLALEEGRRLAAERNMLFQWSIRAAEQAGVPVLPVTRLARSVPEGIIDTAIEEECDLVLMPWAVMHPSPGTGVGRIIDSVVRGAPCDVAVVAFDPQWAQAARAEGEPSLQVSRILVPTAGGPHAPLATRLAVSLAQSYGARVTAIYVSLPGRSSEHGGDGEQLIQQTIDAMRRQASELADRADHPAVDEIPIESRVVEASGVVRGIVDAAKEYDLVFVGASDERLIDQVLFGTVPEQIARSSPAPVIMVKRYRGLPRFWLQRSWDALFGALPTLSREEQLDVNRQVRRGAQPAADFFVMMALASVIATFGLLQDSAAVIIGAMLVAPLFTPILAFSLGIVQGHARLLRLAVEAALKGIVLAVGVAVLLTAISPLQTNTPEILARTRPNLFDLAVALASGAAGAYALARKNVAASLPGVAIAAALVPPLAVVGIGLAGGDLGVAGGGALLFATNLIAIVLAGAVTLLLLGFRPAPREEHEARLRMGLVASAIMLVIIIVPLTIVFAQSVSTSQTRSIIQDTLSQELAALPDVRLVELEFEVGGQEVQIEASLYSTRSLTRAEGEQLSSALSRALGKPARLHLVTIPITEIDVSPR